MNDNDLLHRLSTGLSDVANDHPVQAVVRRGGVLRRRRHLSAAAVATLAVTAGVLAVDSRPGSGTAFARWTSAPQPSDAAMVAVLDTSCRTMLEGRGDALPRRLVDRRGDFAVLVYTDGQRIAECSLFRGREGANSWHQGGAGQTEVTRRGEVSARQPVVVEGVTVTYVRGTGSATAVTGWVSDQVDSVRLETAAASVTAVVGDGAFVAWFPDGDRPGGSARLTAYDAAGRALGSTRTSLPGDGPDQPVDPTAGPAAS